MFTYLDFEGKTSGEDIGLLFPGWRPGEKLAVFSPHDDDALIGAGYAMRAAMENGAQAYVFIFCRGDCGYSRPEDKPGITEIRSKETGEAYSAVGIPGDHIVRFGYPDFNAWQYMGHRMRDGSEGAFLKIVRLIRELGITRVMLPNGYREHFDHEAVFRMGAYDAVQAGDPILADMGAPVKVRSFLQYSVWADFSPEDALISGRGAARANRAILAAGAVEETIAAALARYRSQREIIRGLVESRAERRLGDRYLEVYLGFDPRPRLPFGPYIALAQEIIQ